MSDATAGDRFEPVPGLVLSEPFEGSGYQDPPHLARLPGGQVVQLTPLLFAVADAANGQRDSAAIARMVRDRTGRSEVTAADVRHLVDNHLRPAGLLAKDANEEHQTQERFDPLTSLVARRDVVPARWVRRLARPFVPLFAMPLVVLVTLGFVAVQGWAIGAVGITGSIRDALADPRSFVATFALVIASGAFHEFGHAAALLRGGRDPGAMGAGIHIVWPAFYTDVTDAYLLPRRDRLRVDVGGIYFNMLFGVATFGAYLLTGHALLVVVIFLQLVQAAQQLLPFTRLDGYYLISDLVGVPDLYLRMPDILRSLAPGTEPSDRVRALKPWARRAVTGWVLASVLFGVFIVVVVVASFTTVVGDAVARVAETGQIGVEAVADGRWSEALANLLRATTSSLLPIGFSFILLRLFRRGWAAVRDRVAKRRRRRDVEDQLSELDPDDRDRLVATARNGRAQPWARQRARISLATVLGWGADRIADQLDIDTSEVRYWQCRFRRNGVAALEAAPGELASLGSRRAFLDLMEQTKEQLYAQAQAIDLDGRGSMDKASLAAALVAQSEPVPVDDAWLALWNRTRDELYALAQDRDLDGRSSMDKVELLQALAPPAAVDRCACEVELGDAPDDQSFDTQVSQAVGA